MQVRVGLRVQVRVGLRVQVGVGWRWTISYDGRSALLVSSCSSPGKVAEKSSVCRVVGGGSMPGWGWGWGLGLGLGLG